VRLAYSWAFASWNAAVSTAARSPAKPVDLDRPCVELDGLGQLALEEGEQRAPVRRVPGHRLVVQVLGKPLALLQGPAGTGTIPLDEGHRP
jgi:hypothetical protein